MDLIIVIITSIFSLFIGVIVYRDNPKSATNRIFAVLNIAISTWSIANYISLHTIDPISTIIWVRITTCLAIPQAASFFLMSLTIPDEKMPLKKKWFILYLSFVLVTMGLSLSPFMFTNVVQKEAGVFDPVPGPAIVFFAILAFGSVISSAVILLGRFLNSKGMKRLQLGYMLLGIMLMCGLLLLTVVVPTIFFKNISFVAFGPFYALIFLGFTAYAIIRHRLMDIRFVIARTISFSVLIFLFAVFFETVFYLITSFLLGTEGQKIGIKVITVYSVLTVIMAFSFNPARRLIERWTDRIFYKNRYDPSKLLYELALVMAGSLKLEELTRRLLSVLMLHLKPGKSAFILMNKTEIYDIVSEGGKEIPDTDEEKMIVFLKKGKKIFVYEEENDEEVKKIMKEYSFEVVVPLLTEGENMGLLVLGMKLSGDIYDSEDIKVLEICAPEMAVAVHNAKSYEEIRIFNVTLQQEVDKATRELQDANERLLSLDKLKDEFLSMASHDLRTPMTSIKGYSYLIAKDKTVLPEKTISQAEKILSSSERMLALINELLNTSRIEAGRIEIKPEQMDLISELQLSIDEIESQVELKKINLVFENMNEKKWVFADKTKVHEILINLLGNAVKFTPNEGKITLSYKDDGNMVVVSVANNGSEISKENIPKLFTKFGMLDESYTGMAKASGTGLGLYICKKLINLMKGDIWVESGEGKGCIFSFSLPKR